MNFMHKLHLGSGKIIFPGWTNIDIEFGDPSARQDLTMPLPYEDASTSHIFTEHFIEHLDYDEAARLLAECRRILADTGAIRVSTPDLAWLVDVYHSGTTAEWRELWQPQSPCKMMNEGMRSWGHRFLYDRSELHQALRSAGFNNIKERKWHESDHAEFRNKESRPYHNDIILEADCRPEETAGNEDLMPRAHATESLLIEQGRRLAQLTTVNYSQKAQIASLSADLSFALKHSADQSNHIEGLDMALGNRGRHILGLEESLANLSAHNISIEADLHLLRERINELETIIGNQARHMEGMEHSLQDRARHILGLEQSIADISTHNSSLEVDIASRIACTSELQASIKNLEAHEDELQELVSLQTSEISLLNEQLVALHSDSSVLQSTLEEKSMAMEKLEHSLSYAMTSKHDVESQLQVVEQRHIAAIQTIHRLETEGSSLSRRLEAKSSFIDRIKSTLFGRLAIRMLRDAEESSQP